MRVPVEGHLGNAQIAAVRFRDHAHHHRAILGVAAHGAEPVLRPGERHHAVAADASEGRTQPGNAASSRRAQDRPAGLRADREREASGRRRRSRTGRGSARSFFQVPRILGLPAEPAVARRQFARRQFRQQDRARLAQHLDNARVFVDHLILVGARAPGGLVALHRDDVLGAPRNPVQRSFIFPGRDFRVGLLGLRARHVVEERDHAIQLGVVFMQTRRDTSRSARAT